MKSLMILGALFGFILGVGLGLAQQLAWPALCWRASVGAALIGFLFRWWGGVVGRVCRQIPPPQPAAKHTPLPPRPATPRAGL